MGIQQMLLGAGAAGEVTGQVDFEDHTTHEYTTTWTVPNGVTKISVLCIGRGGITASGNVQGGAGGGLAYMNNITVVPGDVYTIYICGGYYATNNSGVSPYYSDEIWEVGSQIRWLSGTGHPWRVAAHCGVDQNSANPGGYEWSHASLTHGTFVEHSGGVGGGGSVSTSWGQTNYYHGGGGGAAGYAGDGGNGASGSASGGTAYDAASGSGGGGGGKEGWTQNPSGQTYTSQPAYTAGAGGGVGKYGKTNVTGSKGSTQGISGSGGSGGTASGTSTVQTYGGIAGNYGGGCCKWTSGTGSFTNNTVGGKGLVRIIWPGDTRYYPDTLTTDQ